MSIYLGLPLPEYLDDCTTRFPLYLDSKNLTLASIQDITLKFNCENDSLGIYLHTLPYRDHIQQYSIQPGN